ncbi:DHA2 family efflux MFS transporter permease subunit [Paractinoplanes globisporus]|uniref:DHA2 family efflux MFS transporter permease subunit n=1 Tax=Paractinoplanes globisporus TaxID=113565 RepID=A0ABW6W9N4_9ACTN|nr:DHA2 family efflux MFS transporter permease subunit [Actinoplanes globisporus]
MTTTPLRSQVGVALIAATVLASMVGFLDANVVNVAVPAIGKDLGAGVAGLQWALTGYLLTVAALLLLSGALADHFGRRRILIIGLLAMLGSSVLCAVAPTIGVLIAARVLQGAGAAMVVPTSLALLNGTLRVGDRARGIGIWAGLATIGSTVGPYAGGWLVDHAGWRWIFLLNVPLILLALLALRWVPEATDEPRPLSLDLAGALLAILGIGGVIFALTRGAASGWADTAVLVAGIVGVAALIALTPVERRVKAPMVRLSLFKSRQFDAINVTTVLFYGALAAGGYLLVLQCQLVLGYTAAQAGAVAIPNSILFLVLSPVAGALVPRIGPRWLMVAGIVSVAAGFAWLSQAQAGDTYASAILPGVLLQGLGLGLAVTPLTSAVLAAVDDADLGEASAVNDAASRVGAVLAVAAVPLLIGAGGGDLGGALVDGFRPAMLVLAVFCVLSALVTGVFVSDRRAVAKAPRLAPPAACHACALPATS